MNDDLDIELDAIASTQSDTNQLGGVESQENRSKWVSKSLLPADHPKRKPKPHAREAVRKYQAALRRTNDPRPLLQAYLFALTADGRTNLQALLGALMDLATSERKGAVSAARLLLETAFGRQLVKQKEDSEVGGGEMMVVVPSMPTGCLPPSPPDTPNFLNPNDLVDVEETEDE